MGEIISIDQPVEYSAFLKTQEEIQLLRAEQKIGDRFYILEHFPVFTQGRNFGEKNVPQGDSGIPVVRTNRGGDTTYHAPGQIVIYPIISLVESGITLKEYIFRLEQLAIDLADGIEILSERNAKNHGVWIGDKKLASLGVSVKKGVTMHGIAINVSLDLSPFRLIVPCGLEGVEMASFSEIIQKEIPLSTVINQIKRLIPTLFPECFSNA